MQHTAHTIVEIDYVINMIEMVMEGNRVDKEQANVQAQDAYKRTK